MVGVITDCSRMKIAIKYVSKFFERCLLKWDFCRTIFLTEQYVTGFYANVFVQLRIAPQNPKTP